MSWRSICITGFQIAAKRFKRHKNFTGRSQRTQRRRFLTEANEGNEGGFSRLCFSGADDLLHRSQIFIATVTNVLEKYLHNRISNSRKKAQKAQKNLMQGRKGETGEARILQKITKDTKTELNMNLLNRLSVFAAFC